MIEHLLIQ